MIPVVVMLTVQSTAFTITLHSDEVNKVCLTVICLLRICYIFIVFIVFIAFIVFIVFRVTILLKKHIPNAEEIANLYL